MTLWRSRSLLPLRRLLQVESGSFNAFHYFSTDTADTQSLRENMMRQKFHLDINSQIGSCMPLNSMRIGTIIHNIEMKPGQGGKLVRAAGTSAKILKDPTSAYCLIKLPSGAEKLIDSRCRATIGQVSNPDRKNQSLRKAGQSRWLGRRPVVRGVAMNPVDHPHGGGEGKSKSSGGFGRVSQTPWGKPTKSGYKTGPLKRKNGSDGWHTSECNSSPSVFNLCVNGVVTSTYSALLESYGRRVCCMPRGISCSCLVLLPHESTSALLVLLSSCHHSLGNFHEQ